MLLELVFDTMLLFILGLLGWFLLGKLRIPAPEVLGPATLIGLLRVFQVDLPLSPAYIFPVVQVIIGIFVGSMLNRDAVRELKSMLLPVVLVITWALSILFCLGYLLDRYTAIDLYTAMLAASMGGLPEITIIAIASGAGIPVIVAAQMLRMLGSIFIFPLIINRIERQKKRPASSITAINPGSEQPGCEGLAAPAGSSEPAEAASAEGSLDSAPKEGEKALASQLRMARSTWKRVILTLTAATTGGIIFDALNVPAGLLVGATIFVAILSVSGIKVSRLSPRLFNLLLVFIGINIGDHITAQSFSTIGSPPYLVPILLITLFTFITSFGMSALIYRITGWDYPTCFLAAAPGGFTIMTALAIKYELNPFRVSMLHLCRLLSINISLPFIFMYLMNR